MTKQKLLVLLITVCTFWNCVKAQSYLLIFVKSYGQFVTDATRGRTKMKGHLRSLIEEFKHNCLLDKTIRNKYYNNSTSSKNEIITFLNKAFDTQIFNKYFSLEECSSEIIFPDDKHNVSWEMVEIGFKSRKDNEKAIAIIKSQDRGYLHLEVATAFVLLKEKNTIIIIFAEATSLNNDIMKCFFNRLKMMKGRYIPI